MYDAHDLTWQEYDLPSGDVVLAKRCVCRAAFVDTIVISVHRMESRVDLFLYQGDPVREVLVLKPSTSFIESDITPAAIYQFIGQDDTERVIGEIAAIPFTVLYPASRYIDGLLEKWRRVRYPGWIYSTLGTRGFSLLKDFDAFVDGRFHSVEVSDRGISIYHSNIQDGCTLSNDDRMLFMDTEVIGSSPDTIADLCGWKHSYEICGTQRAVRRWLFHAVVTKSI
jgi:hypothetical protein